MKFSRITALLLAALMALSLAACGSDPSSAPSTQTSGTGSAETEASSAEGLGTTSNVAAGTGSSTPGNGGAATQKTTKKATTARKTNGQTVRFTEPTINQTAGDHRNVDFKGAQFRFLMTGGGSQYPAMISAYEKKFNCKIIYQDCGFGDYPDKLIAAMNAGTPSDIVFLHNYFFPGLQMANLVQPIQDVVLKGDLSDPKNMDRKDGSGISLTIMQGLTWDGNYYAMNADRNVAPEFIYYNKKLIKDYGLQDPYELYKQGKWTWEAFADMGRIFTDKGKGRYLAGAELAEYCHYVVLANGGEFVKVTKDRIAENLTDTKVVNALKQLQGYTSGNNAIISTKGGLQNNAQFLNGNVLMYFCDGFNFDGLYKDVKNFDAFGKSSSNLGFVPIPFGADNKDKIYPIHSYQGFCAGKGTKDPRAAVTWALFQGMYKNPSDNRTGEFIKVWNSLLDSGKFTAPVTGFSSPNNSVDNIVAEIGKGVARGENISKLLADNRPNVKEVLDYCLQK